MKLVIFIEWRNEGIQIMHDICVTDIFMPVIHVEGHELLNCMKIYSCIYPSNYIKITVIFKKIIFQGRTLSGKL